MSDTPPPCRDCKCSPCTYITASHCERLREWQDKQNPRTKSMVVLTGVQAVLSLIVVLMLSNVVYVGYQLVSAKYDLEIVDLVQAAFSLGVLLGVTAMMAITFMKLIMGAAVDLCVRGLKHIKGHITGENQKHLTQAQIKGGGG